MLSVVLTMFCCSLAVVSGLIFAQYTDEGTYEHFDINEMGEIHDKPGWEDAIHLTSSEISFYIQNPSESPIQREISGSFNLSGKAWKNFDSSEDNLRKLLSAYYSTVWVQTLYECIGCKYENRPRTVHGSGFHIDRHQVITAKHNVPNYLCIAQRGRLYMDVGMNLDGNCNDVPPGSVLNKYTRKKIVTEWGSATIEDESKTGKKYGAETTDDVILLRVGGDYGHSNFVTMTPFEIDINKELEVIVIGYPYFGTIELKQNYDVTKDKVLGEDILALFAMRIGSTGKCISIGSVSKVVHNGYSMYHSSNTWMGMSGGLIVLAKDPSIVVGIQLGGQSSKQRRFQNQEIANCGYTTKHPFLSKYMKHDNQTKTKDEL